jgi:hypothetical protein
MYLPNGYLDFDWVSRQGATFNVLIGGRGIGKTYGCLKYVTRAMRPFLLLRRTQSQTDIISNADFHPLKKPYQDDGKSFVIQKIPKTNATKVLDDNDEIICYNMALSTFANVRGYSSEDINCIVYDEFIPSPTERPIKDEGHAFLHCYETINRNREIAGKPPVKVFLLANAFDFTSSILRVLSLSETIEKMIRRNKEHMIIRRGEQKILLCLPKSPITKEKEKTALYQIADGSFKKLALENRPDIDTGQVIFRPLQEYRLIVSSPEFCIHKHKTRPEYYVTPFSGKAREHYDDTPRGRMTFYNNRSAMIYPYMKKQIFFQNALTEKLFVNWLTKKIE